MTCDKVCSFTFLLIHPHDKLKFNFSKPHDKLNYLKKEVSKLLTKSRYLSDFLNTTINVLRTVELYEHL